MMYQDLGTYTTIDTPIKNEDEALDYLQREFKKIGGNVRRKMNPHDLGSYFSFEIDFPKKLEEIADIEDDLEIDDERKIKIDEWIEKGNKIEENYNKKFSKWL